MSETPEEVVREALTLGITEQKLRDAWAALDTLVERITLLEGMEGEEYKRANRMERERDEAQDDARTAWTKYMLLQVERERDLALAEVRGHETLAERKWRAYVDALVPPRDQALLDGLRDENQRLREALRDIAQYRGIA